jgi:beta-carotene 15,15'-dioxygenase
MYIRSNLFLSQIAVQLLLIAAFFFFSVKLEYQAIFCGMLLCTVGIPHGANDHLYRPDKSLIGMIKFLGVYLGTMLLYVGLWWMAPLFALILFFVISFHHFGQSNFENESIKHLPSWLWGIWILALPVLLHFNEATDIFKRMLSSEIETASLPTYRQIQTIDFNWQLILIAVLGTLYLISLVLYERKNLIRYLIQFIVVSLWYFFTPLLSGFIIVFCLWHALQSLQHQTIYFKQSTGGTGLQFAKAILPFSLTALISFGVYVYFREFKIAEAFILLSLITLPHVLVMHRLYHKTNHTIRTAKHEATDAIKSY